jgi:hypothetical protein
MILNRVGRLVRTFSTGRAGEIPHLLSRSSTNASADWTGNTNFRMLWRGDRLNPYSSDGMGEKEKKVKRVRKKTDEPAPEPSEQAVRDDLASNAEEEWKQEMEKMAGTPVTLH